MSGALLLAAASVDVAPNASGLPGTSSVLSLIDGLQFYVLLATIAGLLLGVGWWALASHSNNYQGASHGRATVIASGIGAVLAGFGPVLIQWLFNFGQSAH